MTRNPQNSVALSGRFLRCPTPRAKAVGYFVLPLRGRRPVTLVAYRHDAPLPALTAEAISRSERMTLVNLISEA